MWDEESFALECFHPDCTILTEYFSSADFIWVVAVVQWKDSMKWNSLMRNIWPKVLQFREQFVTSSRRTIVKAE